MLPSLNHIILTVALQALREGNIHHCETMGFTYDEMNLLGCLSINDLITLSQAPLPLVDITIRHDVLQKLLASSHEENRRQEQLNRAVRLGGSIALMNRYFGVGSRETCARRRLLGVSVPNGRTPIPDEETDAAIWHQWQKYRVENIDSPEALDAMMHGYRKPFSVYCPLADRCLELHHALRKKEHGKENTTCQMKSIAIRRLMNGA